MPVNNSPARSTAQGRHGAPFSLMNVCRGGGDKQPIAARHAQRPRVAMIGYEIRLAVRCRGLGIEAAAFLGRRLVEDLDDRRVPRGRGFGDVRVGQIADPENTEAEANQVGAPFGDRTPRRAIPVDGNEYQESILVAGLLDQRDPRRGDHPVAVPGPVQRPETGRAGTEVEAKGGLVAGMGLDEVDRKILRPRAGADHVTL